MAIGNTPIIIPPKSQEALIEYLKKCHELYNGNINIRERMRKVDLAYNREKNQELEQKKAKMANTYGNQGKLQSITIPVVMPQVESAVVYQTSVFLQGTPIFGVAPTPEFANEALQMEAIIADNQTKGGWVREVMMTFRDGFKYNIAAAEVIWDREVEAALETNVQFSASQGKPKTVNWEGNKIRRMDMYNTFWDIRVAPSRVHKDGEFVGYKELMSRIKLKDFINKLPEKIVSNVTRAFECGYGSVGAVNAVNSASGIQNYYIPDLNVDGGLLANITQGMNWLSWAGLIDGVDRKIQYRNMYEVTTLYARILPSDFDIRVPQSNTPQVWKFIVINNEVLIYAERQTNAHGYIPIIFAQPNEDGLTYQTKSLATNVEPIQDVTSSLMDSVLAARRRAISDRGLYDPSRVTEGHINSVNPSAKIPVRPAAYGKPLSEAYFPIPFRDDESPLVMQQIPQLVNFANQISGQNPAKQGQFVKGNKTTREFETVMGNANGRDQTTSLLLEDQFFAPVKEIIKLNILQYQGPETLYNPKNQQAVSIDPVALRKASLKFKISDGLIPEEKLISADVLMVAFQQIGASPMIGAGYNIAPMFSYLMKSQGADITPFEKSPEQMAYEQAVQQWQQTVMQMVTVNKEIRQDQYPPMPVPEQFGYQPQGNNVAPPRS